LLKSLHFLLGGLLPRPPPDGAFGTLLGQFGFCEFMIYLSFLFSKRRCDCAFRGVL